MLKNIYIALVSLFCATLFAQEPIHYTTKQGLPSNHIYDIQEDANGFMWFATNRGLVKFDGETFKTFTLQDGLPNNDTWLLELDGKGGLWYFSKSSYQGYIKNDSIYKFQTKDKEVLSPEFISKTKEELWFVSNSKMLMLKDTTLVNVFIYNKKYSSTAREIEKQEGINFGKIVSTINPIDKEFIYILKNKFLIYDWDFNFKEEIPNTTAIDFTSIKTTAAGILPQNLFYKASGTNIKFLNLKTKKAYTFDLKTIDNTITSTDYIKCKGFKNEIQVSIPGYLLVFNYNLELIRTHSFSKGSSNFGSFKDSKGNIWLRSFTNGISMLPNTQLQTQYYLKNKKIQKVTGIDSTLFIGIQRHGFYKLNNQTNSIETIKKTKNTHSEIYKIKKDPISKQVLFISGGESYSYNTDKHLKELEYNIESYPFNYKFGFKDITRFNNFDYYISSRGVFKANPSTKKGVSVTSQMGILTSVVFKNRLFYGGSDGLYELVNDTLVKPKVKNKALNTSINTLTSTTNVLCIGTDGRGVYIYDDNEVIHLKNTDGFSIQKIIKKDDKLWIATNNGVHQMSLDTTDFANSKITNSFYESDGLLQNNTNDIFIEKNTLYTASDIGLAKLNLDNKIYKQQPKPYFKTKNDTLSYTKSARDNITITFASQNYTNQENITYQYRLLPTQKEWQNTTTKTLNFSNLSPKLYQLEVKATDQHFNTTTVSQYLDVIPMWWQTFWAEIGFGIIAVLAFLGFVKILKSRIAKKEEEKAEQDKRISGLELQTLRSQMNPHFVHNSLNAIQYFIQRNEVELSEEYLSKFSHLIRLFFEYSRRQTITIQEELELLTHYLDIEKLRFEEKLNYKITVCNDIDTKEQEMPSMLLQPLVENAVNHGLFHKEDLGNIFIKFKQCNEEAFMVTIIDDGIGINKSKEIYNTSSKNYKSNSSEVLKERLFLLNRSNQWDIEYSIEDRSTINTNETGAIATLIFAQLSS